MLNREFFTSVGKVIKRDYRFRCLEMFASPRLLLKLKKPAGFAS